MPDQVLSLNPHAVFNFNYLVPWRKTGKERDVNIFLCKNKREGHINKSRGSKKPAICRWKTDGPTASSCAGSFDYFDVVSFLSVKYCGAFRAKTLVYPDRVNLQSIADQILHFSLSVSDMEINLNLKY